MPRNAGVTEELDQGRRYAGDVATRVFLVQDVLDNHSCSSLPQENHH